MLCYAMLYMLTSTVLSATFWRNVVAVKFLLSDNCMLQIFLILICFPMDYRDFSVKSKVIIHCFKQ